MKKIAFAALIVQATYISWAQTNVFPTNGNVGIGTTSPNYPLEVNGQISYNGAIREGGDATLSSFGTALLHGNSTTWSEQRFFTSGNQSLTINSLGNVGIGTVAPANKLSIIQETTDTSEKDLLMIGEYRPSSNTPLNGNGVGISFAFADNYNAPKVRGSIQLVNNYFNQRSSMIFRTANNDQLFDRMTINGYGDVGIGTTTPANKLSIIQETTDTSMKDLLMIGEYRPSSNTPLSGNGVGISFAFADNYNAPKVRGSIQLVNNYFNQRSSMIFRTADNDQLYDRMIINGHGDVGIGTVTTFGYKLAVNGTIGAKEIIVENSSAWPDFVFEHNYDLLTLEEVENYISENKHLPEIPSEVEVSKNGINLGEMDTKLLQKIEELTLYLIEQNKQNLEQQKLIEQLQKEVYALKNE